MSFRNEHYYSKIETYEEPSRFEAFKEKLADIGQILKWIVVKNYHRTYSPDSYDSNTGKFNNETLPPYNYDDNDSSKLHSSVSDYEWNSLTEFTTFIGWPNECDEDGIFDGRRALLNFVGWQDNKTWGRTLINYLLTPYAVVKNSIFIVAILSKNLVKVFTEFLPGVVSSIFAKLAKPGFEYSEGRMKQIWNDGYDEINDESYDSELSLKNPSYFRNFVSSLANGLRTLGDYTVKIIKSIPYALVYALSCLPYILSLAAKAVKLIGRAVTSPINSVDAAWSMRETMRDSIYEWLAEQTITINGEKRALLDFAPRLGYLVYLGDVAAFLLSALSVAVTTTAYAFLSVVLFSAAPVIGLNLTPVLNFLAPALTHASAVFTAIGNVVLPLLGQLSTVLTPAMAGFITVLGASLGFSLTTIGPVVNQLTEMCRQWWRTSFPLPPTDGDDDNLVMNNSHVHLPSLKIRQLTPIFPTNKIVAFEPRTKGNFNSQFQSERPGINYDDMMEFDPNDSRTVRLNYSSSDNDS